MARHLRVPKLRVLLILAAIAPAASTALGEGASPRVDWEMVAKIREEGLQRSQVMETASYIADVLGARLTLSNDMSRAQAWAESHMKKLGLANVVVEPFMDYGIRWDNEYVSLHLLEPDYQPMVGYPLSHTPGTEGKQTTPVVLADIRTRGDLEKHRGKLRGVSVLSTPPAVVDRPGSSREQRATRMRNSKTSNGRCCPRPRRRPRPPPSPIPTS